MTAALPATWSEAHPVLEAMTSVDGSLDTLFEEHQKHRGLIDQLRNDIDQLQRTVGVMGQTVESLDASYGRMADELQNMRQAIQPLLNE